MTAVLSTLPYLCVAVLVGGLLVTVCLLGPALMRSGQISRMEESREAKARTKTLFTPDENGEYILTQVDLDDK